MTESNKIVVHVTHEAARKIGGIGAVLEGMLTSNSYRQTVGRSILVAPLFNVDEPSDGRLGPEGDMLYSSLDGRTHNQYASRLAKVERDYKVNIVYGRRTLHCPWSQLTTSPEVLLIDVSRVNEQLLNRFKGRLYDKFHIRSDRYEQAWEYEQYVRLAEPALAAIKALGVCRPESDCIVIAHEFMGIPTALAAVLDPQSSLRTVFYAHETAPIRKIVEDSPGHDTMFYNVLAHALDHQHYLQDVFGDMNSFFKFPLVKASQWCDNILAVGDYVAKEMRFLCPEFAEVDIDVVYNGLPAWQITVQEKLASKKKLQDYSEILLGYRPDHVFTHVTRLVTSKGLWRDLRVMRHLELELLKRNQTAVLLVLSCELPYRDPKDIYNMEQWWHWPVVHREGHGDLTAGEALFYSGVQEVNAQGRAVKVLFLNQFGFNRQTCGQRMPADTSFVDIRRGTDVEFGQSIYEPFGISQLEPLSFGTLCVVSHVCGCVGFARAISQGKELSNIIVANYTNLGPGSKDFKDLLAIGRPQREAIEDQVAHGVAQEILKRLPISQEQLAELINNGYDLARKMSWEEVTSHYVLPALDRACRKYHVVASA